MFIQVVTTVDEKNAAEKIAETVVSKRLAACVQITTCTSFYRWQGKMEKADEFQCIMKSSRKLYPALEKTVREIHPYEVPEILAVDITGGNPDYLAWLEQELAG